MPFPAWISIIGVIILLPEFLYWLFVSHPRQKRMEASWERTRLFWSIRDKEMDIYGEWKS